MPGVHGGGEPAKAFAAMTDFHYLTLARAELMAKREPRDEWSKFRNIAPAEPLRSALVFGAMLAMCVLLARKPRHVGDTFPGAVACRWRTASNARKRTSRSRSARILSSMVLGAERSAIRNPR